MIAPLTILTIHSIKPTHEQQVSALYNPSKLNPAQRGYREINQTSRTYPTFSHKPSEANITALPPGILEGIQAKASMAEWVHSDTRDYL